LVKSIQNIGGIETLARSEAQRHSNSGTKKKFLHSNMFLVVFSHKFRNLFLIEQEVGANKMALNGIRVFALNDIQWQRSLKTA
jgi:hypothetical protein